MKKLIKATSEDIFGMSNVRGKFIKVEQDIPFSFYYSPKNGNHGPRVKVRFNPNKINLDSVGTLKLCDDWEFISGPDDNHVSNSDIKTMKEFFRKYLILFLLVWDKHVDDPELEDYFRGDISLADFIRSIDFYTTYSNELEEINNVTTLEEFCRDTNLVNMYGN